LCNAHNKPAKNANYGGIPQENYFLAGAILGLALCDAAGHIPRCGMAVLHDLPYVF
jgi:hypothetical protein